MKIQTALFVALFLICSPMKGYTEETKTMKIAGEWIQGGLLTGRVEPGQMVSLNDEPIFVDQDGFFVFGLGRDAAPVATLAISRRGEIIHKETFSVKQREYNIQRVTGIAQNIMTPSKEDQERSQMEAIKVAKARETFLLDRNFLTPFSLPVKGPITGVYGSQRIYNDVPGTPHYGVDYAAPVGTPITTPAPGLVILAEPDLFYSGGTIIVDHGYGVSSTFMHLSKVQVAVGDSVVPGDPIGQVGATGRVSGAHLDWRMNWKDVRVDPQLLLKQPLVDPATDRE